MPPPRAVGEARVERAVQWLRGAERYAAFVGVVASRTRGDAAEVGRSSSAGTVLAGGADVGKLWGDAEGKATAVAIMREVIRAANADLEAHGAAPRLDEEALVEKLSAITDKMAEASYIPSTTNDFLAGRRMEVGAIFEEPVRRATAHGVDVPRLETLAGLLRVANDHIAAAGSWRDVT